MEMLVCNNLIPLANALESEAFTLAKYSKEGPVVDQYFSH